MRAIFCIALLIVTSCAGEEPGAQPTKGATGNLRCEYDTCLVFRDGSMLKVSNNGTISALESDTPANTPPIRLCAESDALHVNGRSATLRYGSEEVSADVLSAGETMEREVLPRVSGFWYAMDPTTVQIVAGANLQQHDTLLLWDPPDPLFLIPVEGWCDVQWLHLRPDRTATRFVLGPDGALLFSLRFDEALTHASGAAIVSDEFRGATHFEIQLSKKRD